jgi:hypothetical protein
VAALVRTLQAEGVFIDIRKLYCIASVAAHTRHPPVKESTLLKVGLVKPQGIKPARFRVSTRRRYSYRRSARVGISGDVA